jgi:hypothetical protein
MLLDAGADPKRPHRRGGGHGGWTPLRCAVAGAANPLITRLLLERGAVPGDPKPPSPEVAALLRRHGGQ